MPESVITTLGTIVLSFKKKFSHLPINPYYCSVISKSLKKTDTMKTSDNGILLIKQFEGIRLEAYRCPAGVYTIGYGHTAGVGRGDRIDEQQAHELLLSDLCEAEAVVNQECPAVNQNQFDALVSFVFNCGAGNFRKSTLLRCVKANPQNPNIRGEFARWNKSGGMILAGLIRRRRAEAELYYA